jgi:hypothetical protein
VVAEDAYLSNLMALGFEQEQVLQCLQAAFGKSYKQVPLDVIARFS